MRTNRNAGRPRPDRTEPAHPTFALEPSPGGGNPVHFPEYRA